MCLQWWSCGASWRSMKKKKVGLTWWLTQLTGFLWVRLRTNADFAATNCSFIIKKRRVVHISSHLHSLSADVAQLILKNHDWCFPDCHIRCLVVTFVIDRLCLFGSRTRLSPELFTTALCFVSVQLWPQTIFLGRTAAFWLVPAWASSPISNSEMLQEEMGEEKLTACRVSLRLSSSQFPSLQTMSDFEVFVLGWGSDRNYSPVLGEVQWANHQRSSPSFQTNEITALPGITHTHAEVFT